MKGAVIVLFCTAALINAEINENGCPINPFIDILKPHPNCNKFYQCVQGKLIARSCAPDLVFNVDTQECDYAENVDCKNKPVAPDSSEEAGDSDNGGGNNDPGKALEICAEDNSDGVLVAHENCNQFYKCSGGIPVAFNCPPNLLFNPKDDQCDWPENVHCYRTPESGSGGGNNYPADAPKVCAAEGSDGVLVAHEKCDQFYMCSGGIPVAFNCPPNLLFNPKKDQCDWPENVHCVRIPDALKICSAEVSDGVLVAHEKCNQFYICAAGLPVARDCPLNLFFNPTSNQCDWSKNVDCTGRS